MYLDYEHVVFVFKTHYVLNAPSIVMSKVSPLLRAPKALIKTPFFCIYFVLSRAGIRDREPCVWRHLQWNNYPGKKILQNFLQRELSGLTFFYILTPVPSENACRSQIYNKNQTKMKRFTKKRWNHQNVTIKIMKN